MGSDDGMVEESVATIDERVASLEGRMQEQSQMFAAIREDIAELGRRMERGFAAIDQRLAGLDHKASTQFYWLLGVQMTTWISLVVLLFGALYRG